MYIKVTGTLDTVM